MKGKKSTLVSTLIISFFTASIFGGIFGFSGAILATQYFSDILGQKFPSLLNEQANTTQGEKIKVVDEDSAIERYYEFYDPSVSLKKDKREQKKEKSAAERVF